MNKEPWIKSLKIACIIVFGATLVTFMLFKTSTNTDSENSFFRVLDDPNQNVYGKNLDLNIESRAYKSLVVGEQVINLNKKKPLQEIPISFDQFGYYNINLTALGPEGALKEQSILKLVLPEALAKLRVTKNKAMFFLTRFNNPFFYSKLDKPVTRLQLAYVLNQLNNTQQEKVCLKKFKDILDEFNELACRSIKKKWLSIGEYQHFNPDDFVTTIQLLTALVDSLNLPISSRIQVPMNINPTHWTSPYIQSLYDADILQDKDFVDFNQPLTQEFLVNVLFNVSDVKQEIKRLTSSPKPLVQLDVHKKLVKKLLKQDRAGSVSLSVDLPETVLYEKASYTLIGQLTGSESLKLNDKVIQVNAEGFFTQDIRLTEGLNTFVLEAAGTKKTFTLNYAPNLVFYDSHWLKKPLHKLVNAQILNSQDINLPNEYFTRREFAVFLCKIFQLQENTDSLMFQDIYSSDPDFSCIQTLSSLSVLNGKNNHFYPNQDITKIEALVALTRLLNYSTTAEFEVLPFSDISSKHWAFVNVLAAYKNGLVSKAPYFYPNKKITFAELLSMITKSDPIKKRLIKRM